MFQDPKKKEKRKKKESQRQFLRTQYALNLINSSQSFIFLAWKIKRTYETLLT